MSNNPNPSRLDGLLAPSTTSSQNQGSRLDNLLKGTLDQRSDISDIYNLPKTNYEKFGDYDQFVTPEADQESIRSTYQGTGRELANGLGRAALKVLPSIIGNVASIADLEDYLNQDKEVGNAVTRYMEELKGGIDKTMPIYGEHDLDALDMGKSEWWTSNFSGLAESAASFALTGAGLGAGVKGLGFLSKIAGASSTVQKAIQAGGGVATAVALNQAEAITSAMSVYDNAFKYQTETLGKSEEEAKQIAADAAAYTVNINRLNLPLNITSTLAFLRTSPMTRQAIQQAGLKSAGMKIMEEGAQEFGEEIINKVAEDEGNRYGKIGKEYNYNLNNTISDVFSAEGLEAGILGALGGIAQTGLSEGLDIATGKSEEQNKLYEKQQASLKQLDLMVGGPSLKSVIENITTQASLINDINDAQASGDELKVESLKNSLLINQAVNSFDAGTTDKLEELYTTISKTPEQEGETKYGKGFRENATKAISQIKEWEHSWNKSMQTTPDDVNKKELFINKLQQQSLNDRINDLKQTGLKLNTEILSIKENSPEATELPQELELKNVNDSIGSLQKQLAFVQEQSKSILYPEVKPKQKFTVPKETVDAVNKESAQVKVSKPVVEVKEVAPVEEVPRQQVQPVVPTSQVTPENTSQKPTAPEIVEKRRARRAELKSQGKTDPKEVGAILDKEFPLPLDSFEQLLESFEPGDPEGNFKKLQEKISKQSDKILQQEDKLLFNAVGYLFKAKRESKDSDPLTKEDVQDIFKDLAKNQPHLVDRITLMVNTALGIVVTPSIATVANTQTIEPVVSTKEIEEEAKEKLFDNTGFKITTGLTAATKIVATDSQDRPLFENGNIKFEDNEYTKDYIKMHTNAVQIGDVWTIELKNDIDEDTPLDDLELELVYTNPETNETESRGFVHKESYITEDNTTLTGEELEKEKEKIRAIRQFYKDGGTGKQVKVIQTTLAKPEFKPRAEVSELEGISVAMMKNVVVYANSQFVSTNGAEFKGDVPAIDDLKSGMVYFMAPQATHVGEGVTHLPILLTKKTFNTFGKINPTLSEIRETIKKELAGVLRGERLPKGNTTEKFMFVDSSDRSSDAFRIKIKGNVIEYAGGFIAKTVEDLDKVLDNTKFNFNSKGDKAYRDQVQKAGLLVSNLATLESEGTTLYAFQPTYIFEEISIANPATITSETKIEETPPIVEKEIVVEENGQVQESNLPEIQRELEKEGIILDWEINEDLDAFEIEDILSVDLEKWAETVGLSILEDEDLKGQEGHYIKLFNHIKIHPKHNHRNNEVLKHEIVHAFLELNIKPEELRPELRINKITGKWEVKTFSKEGFSSKKSFSTEKEAVGYSESLFKVFQEKGSLVGSELKKVLLDLSSKIVNAQYTGDLYGYLEYIKKDKSGEEIVAFAATNQEVREVLVKQGIYEKLIQSVNAYLTTPLFNEKVGSKVLDSLEINPEVENSNVISLVEDASVVDSLAFQVIQDLRLNPEAKTTIDSLKPKFEEIVVLLKSVKGSDKIVQRAQEHIEKYQDVLNRFSEFKAKAEEKLDSMNFTKNKQGFYEDIVDQEDSPSQYQDESSYLENRLDSMPAMVRKLMSYLSDYDANGKIKRNILGLPTYVPVDIISNNVFEVLTKHVYVNSKASLDKMIDLLGQHQNPTVKELHQILSTTKNNQLKQQFYKVFSIERDKPESFVFTDKDGKVKLRKNASDNSSGEAIIREEWVKAMEGNTSMSSLDKDFIAKTVSNFSEFLDRPGNFFKQKEGKDKGIMKATSQGVEELVSILNSLELAVDKPAVYSWLIGDKNVSGKRNDKEHIRTQIGTYIIRELESAKTLEDFITSTSGRLSSLSHHTAITSNRMIGGTYRVDGNTYNVHANSKPMTEKLHWIDSIWDDLQEHPVYKYLYSRLNEMKVITDRGFRENKKGTRPKMMKDSNEGEFELMRILQFQEFGQLKTETHSDKATNFTVTGSTANNIKILDQKEDGKYEVSSEIVNALYNYFDMEVAKIQTYKARMANSALLKLKGVDSTDKVKGAGEYFMYNDSLNAEILADSKDPLDKKILNELYDKNKEGVYRLKDNINLSPEVISAIRSKLKERFRSIVGETLTSWKKFGVFESEGSDVTKINFMAEKYRDKLTKDYSHLKDQAQLTAVMQHAYTDYSLNYVQSLLETNFIFGDPAQQSKIKVSEKPLSVEQVLKGIKETFVNVSKRNARLLAQGGRAAWRKTSYKTQLFNDLDTDSQNVTQYLEEVQKAYKSDKNNELMTDAQEFTTVLEHLEDRLENGEINFTEFEGGMLMFDPEHYKELLKNPDFMNHYPQASFRPIEINERMTLNSMGLLQPRKPVQVYSKMEGGIIQEYYIKTSSVPIVPALVKDKPFEKVLELMKKNDVQRMTFNSAVKIGQSGVQNLFNEDGSVNEEGFSTPMTLDRSGYHIQLNVPYDEDKHAIRQGSQVLKLLFVDLPEFVVVNGKKAANELRPGVTVQSLKKKYVELQKKMVKEGQTALLEEILSKADISIEGNNYVVRDATKLSEMLIEAGKDRDFIENSLKMLKVDESGNMIFPLTFNPNVDKIQPMLNALVTNAVMRQKIEGKSYVQVSEVMLYDKRSVKEVEDLTEEQKGGIVYTKPEYKGLKKLGFVVKGKDGAQTKMAQVYAPFFFKDQNGKKISISKFVTDGVLDLTRVPEDLLVINGFRIPTEGPKSMMMFEVVGFLPDSMGDTLIVPSEIAVQMGSDYDVDKLYTYNYEVDLNSIADGEVNRAVLSKRKESNSNELIDIHREVLLSPQMFDALTTPQGFDNLLQSVEEIEDLLEKKGVSMEKEWLGMYDPNYQRRVFFDNLAGKNGTALSANANTFHALAQDADLYIGGTGFLFKDEDGEYYNDSNVSENRVNEYNANSYPKEKISSKNVWRLGKVLTFEGKSISNAISEWLGASVDNAKAKLLGRAGINDHNLAVGLSLVQAGFDNPLILSFINQPILKDYYDAMDNAKSMFNSKFETEKIEKAIREVYKKYAPEKALNNLMLKDLEGFTLSEYQDMLGLSSKTVSQEQGLKQVAVLRAFLHYKGIADNIRNVQSSFVLDSKGLPKNHLEILELVNRQDLIGGSLIKNVRNLEDTVVGPYINIPRFTQKLFSDIYYYGKPAYQNLISEIKLALGKTDLLTDELNDIYNGIYSFVYSIPQIQDKVADGRIVEEYKKDLIQNLAPTIQRMKKLHPDNNLLRRVTISDGVPVIGNNFTTSDALEHQTTLSWLDMIKSDQKDLELKQLGLDLAAFTMYYNNSLFGVSNFMKYVPFEYFQSIGLSKSLQDLGKSLEEPEYLENFTKQYFQHNPSLAKSISIDFNKYKKVEVKIGKSKIVTDVKLNKETQALEVTADFGSEFKPATYFPFVKNYNKSTQQFDLYELVGENTESIHYKLISHLGNEGTTISEYNFNNSNQESNLKSNLDMYQRSDVVMSEAIVRKGIFTVSPVQKADEKAVVKASVATQFIGFGEGIIGSSTELYRQQILKQSSKKIPKIGDIVTINFEIDYKNVEVKAKIINLEIYLDETISNKGFSADLENIKTGKKYGVYVDTDGTISQFEGKGGLRIGTDNYIKEFNIDSQKETSIVNSGNYSTDDVIFVSIGGKRPANNLELRKSQQDRTIKEAIKAIEAGATLITDNKSYVESSTYNEGEKRLAKNLEAKGYTYSEQIVEGKILGVWKNSSMVTPEAKVVPETIDKVDSVKDSILTKNGKLITDPKSLLVNIQLQGSEYYRALAKHISDNLGTVTIETGKLKEGRPANYFKGVITLDLDQLKDKSVADIQRIVLHEFDHALTASKLKDPEFQQTPEYKELTDMHQAYKNTFSEEEKVEAEEFWKAYESGKPTSSKNHYLYYAYGSLDEFVTGVRTSPQVQQYMAGKLGVGKTKSVVNRIIQILKDALGIQKDSLLEDAYDAILKVVEYNKPVNNDSFITEISKPTKATKKTEYTWFNSSLGRNVTKTGYRLTIPEFPNVELYITNQVSNHNSKEGSPELNTIQKAWNIEVNTKEKGSMTIPTGWAETLQDVIETFTKDINEKHSKTEQGRKVLATIGINFGKPVVETVESNTDTFQYYGKNYKIVLKDGIGIDVSNYLGKESKKRVLLSYYNSNPDVDPQSGNKFRNKVEKQPEVKSTTPTGKLGEYELFPGVFANEGQRDALDTIKKFLKSSSDEFLLKGRGGTGKTTIINKALEGNTPSQVIGATVSDEARGILQENMQKYTTVTTASLLGLIPDYKVTTGELYFRERDSQEELDFQGKGGTDPIEGKKIIIIDESSMIGEDLYELIMKKKDKDAKVIFMGDNAQIPPIPKEGSPEKDSPVFKLEKSKDNFRELTERMRQGKESPILPITDVYAENIEDIQEGKEGLDNPLNKRVSDISQGKGVDFIIDRESFLNEFVKDLKKSEDLKETIIVAAKNKTVDALNQAVREKIFTNAKEEPFIIGDRIRVNSPYVVNKQILYPNGFKVSVKGVEKTKSSKLNVPVYKIKVIVEQYNEYTGEIELKEKFLTTVNPKDKEELKKSLNKLAIEAKKYPKRSPESAQAWKEFYDFKALFVDLGYNYAVTAHKVQGSTYNSTYVVEQDIMNFPGSRLQRNRMMYTAISRPRNKLVIYNPTQEVSASLDSFELPSKVIDTMRKMNSKQLEIFRKMKSDGIFTTKC